MMIEITSEQLREIADAISNSLTWESVNVRPKYSGRGMFGKTCIGFSGPSDIAYHTGVGMAQVLGSEAGSLNPSMDNMGLGSIIYFTNLQLAEGESWNEDEDDDEY